MSVTTERRESVLVIHMDDGRANAVTFDLCKAVTAAVREAEDDPDLKAIVVRGRDGRFSGGFDLGVMRGDDQQAISDLCADGAMLVHTLYGAKVPVVVACTGHALAMGTMIVQGGDVRIGPDDDSKIGMNELAIGMSLPDWALTILAERLAPQHVQRALMTARVYRPAEAVEAGYLDEVVAPDRVVDRALEVATELAATIDQKARWLTLEKLRGEMLDTLAAQAEAFRHGGSL
jgi:enoyl-CoA hydratase